MSAKTTQFVNSYKATPQAQKRKRKILTEMIHGLPPLSQNWARISIIEEAHVTELGYSALQKVRFGFGPSLSLRFNF